MAPERLVPGTPEWDIFEAEHRQRYEFVASECRGLRVLDVACGVGYGSQLLARAGAASVTAVDISREAIEYARANFPHPNVEYQLSDATDLRHLARRFDAAVSFETIEHLADPRALLREVHGVLVAGGFFACSTPNRDFGAKGEDNPYHLCELSYDEFRSAFAKYFGITGTFHQSPSPAYLRSLAMLAEIESIHKQLSFSFAFRAEIALRKLLGKPVPTIRRNLPALQRITPDDYVIQSLEEPSPAQPVFIFTGSARKTVQVEVAITEEFSVRG